MNIKNINWKIFFSYISIPALLTLVFIFLKSKNFFDILDFLSSMTAIPALLLTCAALYRIDEVREKIQAEIDIEGLNKKHRSKVRLVFWEDYQNNLDKTIKNLESDIHKYYGDDEVGISGNANEIYKNLLKCRKSILKYSYIEIKLEDIRQKESESDSKPELKNSGYSKEKFEEFKKLLEEVDIKKIVREDSQKVEFTYLEDLSIKIHEFKIFCEQCIDEIRNDVESYNLNTKIEETHVSSNNPNEDDDGIKQL